LPRYDPELAHRAAQLWWAEGWLPLYRYFEASFVLDAIGGEFPATWVDAGSGEGRFAELLKSGSARYSPGIAIDLNRERLESAPPNLYHSRVFSQLDDSSLPDESVSLVICNSVLEHTENPEAVLGEFSRILKRGGILVLTVPTEHFESLLAGSQLFDCVGLHSIARRYAEKMSIHIQHRHYWAFNEARHLMESQGLNVVHCAQWATARMSALGDLLHLVRVVGLGGSRFSKLTKSAMTTMPFVSRLRKVCIAGEVRAISSEAKRLGQDPAAPCGMLGLVGRKS
jgi:ubiquinone/menaquinone biosynthesis C-methylase UbiE